MTVVFFTNFINQLHTPLGDELYKLFGGDYTLVATMEIPQWIIDSGYPDFSDKPYLLKAFENEDNLALAQKIALDADIVIIGSAPESLFKERLKNNKLTFRYSERYIKKLDHHLLSPRTWWDWYNKHTKYRNKNLYMLCASAYTKNDVSKMFAYPNKCYKWGYFTKVENLDIEKIIEQKPTSEFKLLWCARFHDWKHPELPIRLAYELKKKGYSFQINMVGSGVEFNNIKQLIHKLNVSDCVNLLGNYPNEEVLRMMREHHIFLFTSDRGEGWGAVMNEAMSNGCAVVASNTIGATPYLIEDGNTGYIFKSGNLYNLLEKVQSALDNKLHRELVTRRAYKKMKDVWSPKVAAERFIILVKNLINGTGDDDIISGPCSKALPVNPKKIIQ
jgi:glycosyltransferase involved in cell wall biosynthesis